MFDKDKFSYILRKINSTYDTMADFAKQANVDRGYISKYINKTLDNPPSPKILKRLADSAVNITTYEELMRICNYTTDKILLDIFKELKEIKELLTKL